MQKGSGVYDEWGPLKEIVVGRADTAKATDWKDYYDYLMADTPLKAAFKVHPQTPFKDMYPKFVEEYAERSLL